MAPTFKTRPSASKVRPEEVQGEQDHVPGEPVEGSRSSNPPRRVLPQSQGVRRAVVAPMRNAVDLEVKVRGSDRDVDAERARITARMASNGHQNVTVNYRDRTPVGSLRMRGKIRQQMKDED